MIIPDESIAQRREIYDNRCQNNSHDDRPPFHVPMVSLLPEEKKHPSLTNIIFWYPVLTWSEVLQRLVLRLVSENEASYHAHDRSMYIRGFFEKW